MKARDAYHAGSDFQFEHAEIPLGAPSSYSLTHDPKHLVFVLARYKFCAKMLQGFATAMEIGAGDGIGMPIVAKAVGQLHCVDWDERHQTSIRRRLLPFFPNIQLHLHDINAADLGLKVDAAYWIDVIEHLDPEYEETVMQRITACLPEHGVLVTGTPNLAAAHLASPCSAVQHINLKSMQSLHELMQRHFHNVFMFGMNDEVLHTGYPAMCHYIWSVACGVKRGGR